MTNETVGEAREAAAAAMRRLRDSAARVLAGLAETQPVAPHHLLALRAIASGARTPGDVASAVDRHASSVSRLLDQLVDMELVDRRQDPDDRRQVLLTLTDRGGTVVHRFERLDTALSTQMMDGFDAEDARRLAGYLDRLGQNAADLATTLESDPDAIDALT